MMWNDLVANLPVDARGGAGNPVVTDVTRDSRACGPGSLYVSIPGFKVHGDTFIRQAVDKGACAVVSENDQDADACGVVWAKAASARKYLGLASRLVYGIDLSRIRCVGITGTNGKTTTAHLFRALLSQNHEADEVWMFGTIRYYRDGASEAAHNTTPEAAEVFRDIHAAKKAPAAIIMEVSSHSLSLDRVAGLSYDCALFTNLTQDHLDFHKTMEAYYQAKKSLFTGHLKEQGKAVINIDDDYGKRLAAELPGDRVVTFGKAAGADVRIVNSLCEWNETAIDLAVKGTTFHFTSKLAGSFNVYNMTALCAGAYALGIGMDQVRRCFGEINIVPGRMEKVPLDVPYSVFVDYAHTPDALENVLSTAAKLTKGRLICLFGCGGDRDKKKRPLMAQAVARHADEAIVTSDNPRSEEPQDIIDDILKGIPLDFPHQVVLDRKEAIRSALGRARASDCIIVAGKGHEDYQEIKGVRHHFDDREEVQKAFEDQRHHAN
jgi:UDP-N-acetylmuramoyl-L-alanyl-D-glutamate--2,6-diaminopimelate ligase